MGFLESKITRRSFIRRTVATGVVGGAALWLPHANVQEDVEHVRRIWALGSIEQAVKDMGLMDGYLVDNRGILLYVRSIGDMGVRTLEGHPVAAYVNNGGLISSVRPDFSASAIQIGGPCFVHKIGDPVPKFFRGRLAAEEAARLL